MSPHPPLSAADWAEARALFALLVDLAPDDRRPLLHDSGASPAVLAEVVSLLAHADGQAEQTGFLAHPPSALADVAVAWAGQQPPGTAAQGTGGHGHADTLDSAADTFTPPAAEPGRVGQRLGPWRITGLLGRGGMGEVWAAARDDGRYEGQAAVKVLRRGMDSQRVLARFAQEQRSLARLNHPNIARLLDAGATAEGLPYFVMEAVQGQPIDRACAALDMAQRLRLFLQLSDAVAHAHRQLLVHRDLKPGNVLVDAEGQVKLLDFGIAKALDPLEPAPQDLQPDRPPPTLQGERPYTPHYASPEQVRGEPVGTGTDIYSLGVLLYVLLTGVRPYGRHATSPAEAARSVLEEEPTRPSALSPGLVADPQWLATRRRLAGDLDNILLKALDKRAAHRYPSVDALAADIRAHLAGFPVSARAGTWRYQAAKFLGRHRLPAALAGCALLALVGGLVATGWQMHRAEQARALAEAARAQADAQRALAQQRFGQLRQLTSKLVFRYHDQIAFLPGAAPVREALLTDAAAYLDQLRPLAGQDPALAQELAGTYHRIARLQGGDPTVNTGQPGPAEHHLAKALALVQPLMQQPELPFQSVAELVAMHVAQAELAQRRGRPDQGLATLRLAEPLLQRALARDGRDTWALSAAISLHGMQARMLGSQAGLLHLGRWQAACVAADQARAAADATAQADPDNAYWPDSLAFALGEQGHCQLQAGQPQQALALFERQLALRDQMAQRFPDDQDFALQRAIARGARALALSGTGRHAQALAQAAEAVALGRRAAAADARNQAGPARLQALMGQQALVQQAAGQALAARRTALAAVALRPVGDEASPADRARVASLLLLAGQGADPRLLDQALAVLAPLPLQDPTGPADGAAAPPSEAPGGAANAPADTLPTLGAAQALRARLLTQQAAALAGAAAGRPAGGRVSAQAAASAAAAAWQAWQRLAPRPAPGGGPGLALDAIASATASAAAAGPAPAMPRAPTWLPAPWRADWLLAQRLSQAPAGPAAPAAQAPAGPAAHLAQAPAGPAAHLAQARALAQAGLPRP